MFIRAGIDPADPDQAEQFAELIRWAKARQSIHDRRQQKRQQAVVWVIGSVATMVIGLAGPALWEWLRGRWR